MKIEVGVLFSVAIAVLGVFATYFKITKDEKRNREEREIRVRENERRETERHVELKTSLANLTSNVQNILVDQRTFNKELDLQSERLTRVEESTKSAHKRVDTLEEDFKQCKKSSGGHYE